MGSMKTLCQAVVIASAIALIDARPQVPASANGLPSNPEDYDDEVVEATEVLTNSLNMNNSSIESELIWAARQATKAMDIAVPDCIWELAEQVTSKLTKQDLKTLLEFSMDPKVIDNTQAFLKAVGKIEPAVMTTLKAAVGKINSKNVTEIDGLLSELGVNSLFELTINPFLLFKLSRDPDLSQTLERLKELLPVFEVSEVNAMLRVLKTFKEEPEGATEMLKKVLSLPLPLISKLTADKSEPEDIEKM